MNPFLAIAGSIMPDVLRIALEGRGGPDSNPFTQSVVSAVKTILGEDDPDKAREKIAADPAKADALRLELAKLAQAELKLRLDAERDERQQELETLTKKLEAQAKDRDRELSEMTRRLEDTANARQTMTTLAAAGNPLSKAPAVVSGIIVFGFVLTLIILLTWSIPSTPGNEMQWQIINIVIGALTASFATVVSFWLGSSQGSRNKDMANVISQETQVRASRERETQMADRYTQIEKTVSEIDRNVVKNTAIATSVATEVAKAQAPAVVAEATDKPKFANETNFGACVDIILGHEGGFNDDPQDPGGATNLGITLATLRSHRGEPVTKDDVRNLTVEEAREIYRTRYWNALRCDELAHGVDLMVFDFGVNAGPGRAARLLQKVVGANQDGMIGPVTVAAAKAVDPAFIIKRYSELRLEYYKGLSTWPRFGRGWARRTAETLTRAQSML
ncbi:glycosyl hydrolase 108 family protein [Tropicimonas sp. IMCC34043]|uniref:glycosyl hydrolase 108 family protein n=1 Tax=Tropicimonas sp. IMCC34043 TaxID=2248760 RepID=UPI0018E5081D|nr:glycosyl hydrolase 108 family protein [Tropicimonas sp. IMCC34043]